MNRSNVVKIIHLKDRKGLIKARLAGAAEAKADVLVFLDSHCEVSEGWLEPLIDPIARNPRVSTFPLIDTIDMATFEYKPVKQIKVGGFGFDMLFSWHLPPQRETERRIHGSDRN